MKIELLPCVCVTEDSEIHLNILYCVVGAFPITYTVQECLEVWCEKVGWTLLKCFECSRNSYSISIKLLAYENIAFTVANNYYNFADLKDII